MTNQITERVIMYIPKHYISSTLGYTNLKPEQEKVFSEFLGRKDMFVFLPTGFGKSLCYAALPLAFDLKRFGSIELEQSL